VIEREIRDITEDSADRAERLNQIADQFRRGRDINELVLLLDSRDAQLLSIGTWILGELHVKLYALPEIVSRLWMLVEHQDPAVRFNAFGALFPILNPQDFATQSLLTKLRSDPNEGVRKSAEAAATQLSLKSRSQ
jgi:hypothetical protein